MLTQDNFNKAKLVEIGWRFGQSYGGGYLAGQMVMSVIANRTRAGWGSWLDVMQRIPLYMAESELPPLNYPSVWEGAFVKLLHAVEAIYEGSIVDLTKGALYWGSLNKIENPWFKEKVIDAIQESTGLRAHERCADMNSLSFWR